MEIGNVLVILLSLCAVVHSLEMCVNDSTAAICKQSLRPGQFYCESPTIDQTSQAVLNCSRVTRTVEVPCYAAPNVTCPGVPYNKFQCVFTQTIPCRFVDGQRYNYYLAVGLSLFLGMLGIDRFYLGYPAIGLLKLCTFGFFLIGHLLDFLLILLQVVGPADQTGYYAPFYGPLVSRLEGPEPFTTIIQDNICT